MAEERERAMWRQRRRKRNLEKNGRAGDRTGHRSRVGYATDDVGAQLVGSALGRAVAVLSLVTGCAARG
ncbi:hypothetical protein VTN96DRAFT_7170 [Rasamsonia emersonii]